MLFDEHYTKNLHLQKADCLERTRCFSDVKYDLTLNLPRGDYYSGKVIITFRVNQIPHNDDVQIDFRGLNIFEFKINGEQCDTSFNEHKIRLPSASLLIDQENTAQVYFLNMYRTDGVGLSTFTAKECGQQYLKTRFETDFCHTIFPCFD